jgi:hypothetical protein
MNLRNARRWLHRDASLSRPASAQGGERGCVSQRLAECSRYANNFGSQNVWRLAKQPRLTCRPG